VRRGRVGGVAVFDDRKQGSDGGNERGRRFHAFEAGLGLVGASAAEPRFRRRKWKETVM